MEARGMNGQLHFDGVYVTLTRKGFFARSQIGLGEQRIPITSIASVNWKPASKLGINGYIQFATLGDTRRRPRYGQRNLDAARDDTAVTFRYRQMSAFEEVRAAIEQAMARGPMPTEAPMPGQPTGTFDAAAQLRQLDGLRAEGLLTEQEYTQKRAEIIRRL